MQDGPHPQTPSPQAHAPGAQAHPAQQLSFSFFFSIIVSPFERMARSSINADGPECQILQLARGILPRQNTERKKQEGSVENSATPVEMPTAPSRVSCINHDLRGITSFRFSHIAGGPLCLIPGISNALRQIKENDDAQPNEEPRNTEPGRLPRFNQQRN